MKKAALILATGGSRIVKSACSSGTSAIGISPGSCNVIFDGICRHNSWANEKLCVVLI